MERWLAHQCARLIAGDGPEDFAMHLTDQQAAIRAAQRESLVEELVGALKKAEALLGFHEQSAL